MVKLRLARFGKKHSPRYRLVAIQARTKREGNALEYLGTYNPMTKPSTISIKQDRVKYWLDQGAQPTNTVKGILIREGILEKDHPTTKPKKKTASKAKKKEAEVKKPKTEEKKVKEEKKDKPEKKKTA